MEVTYLEYFDLITYGVFIALAINAFYVNARPVQADSGGLPDDNLLIKLLSWPVILLVSILITVVLL